MVNNFVKVRAVGNFVTEVTDDTGVIIGRVGPGDDVEGNWIDLLEGDSVTITRRAATAEEIEAASDDTDQGEESDA